MSGNSQTMHRMKIGMVVFDQSKGAAVITLVDDTGKRALPLPDRGAGGPGHLSGAQSLPPPLAPWCTTSSRTSLMGCRSMSIGW